MSVVSGRSPGSNECHVLLVDHRESVACGIYFASLEQKAVPRQSPSRTVDQETPTSINPQSTESRQKLHAMSSTTWPLTSLCMIGVMAVLRSASGAVGNRAIRQSVACKPVVRPSTIVRSEPNLSTSALLVLPTTSHGAAQWQTCVLRSAQGAVLVRLDRACRNRIDLQCLACFARPER